MAAGETASVIMELRRFTTPRKTPIRRWQVQTHIQGEVTAVDPVESNQVDLASPLPTPPVRWGTATALLPPSVMLPSLLGGDVFRPAATRTEVLYRNDGSTTLTVTLEALRPQNVHDTDPDEFALVVHAPGITELRGTWRITARGHHRVYKGELTIPVEQVNDVGEAIRAVLIPKEDTTTPRTWTRTRTNSVPVLL